MDLRRGLQPTVTGPCHTNKRTAIGSDPVTTGIWIGIVICAAVTAGAAVWAVFFLGENSRRARCRREAEQLLRQAESDAEAKRRDGELRAKEQQLQMRAEFDKETERLRSEQRQREQQLDRRDESLRQLAEDLRKQERGVENVQRRLTQQLESTQQKSVELDRLVEQQRAQLSKISGLSREEATERFFQRLETDLEQEVGKRVLRHERRLAEAVDAKARDMLLTAMQRYASSQTAESTTSTVDIPNDDVKGRIIGREGRNIRAFEKATGVDVIIDDTPGVVIVSGFDPVRREIARQALDKLISDGRIHPSRIEEVVAETEKELSAVIRRHGLEAAEEVGVSGLHDKLIDMLGRLHFRTSYSQNVLRHSVEVAFLSGMLAEMVGMDPVLAKRCGLLHDIGKAADHELEGGHPKIGADLLRRHNERPEVVHAALGHHDQITTDNPYTVLVATADACSASRPGARRESLERYIKRMEELESIAKSFTGVEQAFAIQAGRELRVIASAKQTNDEMAAKLSRDIAQAFERQLTYPGEIKVTVIRESRFTEVAR
jgi:ribonuclease Y